jgi:hypothetical protein
VVNISVREAGMGEYPNELIIPTFKRPLAGRGRDGGNSGTGNSKPVLTMMYGAEFYPKRGLSNS